ncbi:hypothetical protein M0P98_00170 [bacterium]|nr:hypothetical protein [bacterium]
MIKKKTSFFLTRACYNVLIKHLVISDFPNLHYAQYTKLRQLLSSEIAHSFNNINIEISTIKAETGIFLSQEFW